VLAIVATDSTFERREVRGEVVFVGRCIHCGSHLTIGARGETYGATVEHIEPRTHGGTDALDNVALACARCNQQKGARLDARRRTDATLSEVIETLRRRRRERWHEPA
jgi:5-methylcytosine-specific restriction endonuclease McrA